MTIRSKPSVIYTDSRAALEAAWDGTLSRDALVRSPAPAILCDPALSAEPAEERLSPEQIRSLETALIDVALQIHETLCAEKTLSQAEDIGVVASRVIMTDFQDVLRAAALLRDVDFEERPAVVTASFNDGNMDRRFRFRVAEILDEVPNSEIIEIDGYPLKTFSDPTPPSPSLPMRLAYARIDSLIYRLSSILWNKLPFTSPRGGILIARENELLKEAAARFILKGYSVRQVNLSKRLAADTRFDDAFVRGCVERLLCAALSPFLARHAVEIAAERGASLVVAAVDAYFQALASWREELATAAARSTKALFTNMWLAPEAVALYRATQELRIPFVSFQHGFTPEYSKTSRYIMSAEGVCSDLFIAFNEEMVRLNATNPLARAECVAVGFPNEFRKLRRSSSRNVAHPIWYIRTTLYQSNLCRLHRGLCDWDMYCREIRLIDEVFAALPHSVVYKPYPAIRYLDPDPALERAASHDNIHVYEERLDLRYEIGESRVLVTSGATGTIGLCLMSDRPTVFLNDADFMPLKEEVYGRFCESAFVFDTEDPNFIKELRHFLSRPIEQIEMDWRAKSSARRDLVGDYLSTEVRSPGRVAAEAIDSFIFKHKERNS